jgi:hypothetical protein
VSSAQRPKPVAVFNSAVENGLRALVVLAAGRTRRHDLDRLVVLDYLLVHSGDFDPAPPSLHPEVPYRFGEVLVRRPLVETGIHFMASRGLILQEFTPEGRLYYASDAAEAFLDSLRAPHAGRLRERASWVVQRFGGLTTPALEAEFRLRVPVFEFSRIGAAERRERA